MSLGTGICSVVPVVMLSICPILGQEVELSCSDYWSDSAVEVLAFIPFESALPGGTEFFSLDAPALLDSTNHKPKESAHKLSYDENSRTLLAIFCGVETDDLRSGLALRVGPNEVFVPVDKFTRKKMSNGRMRISARSEKMKASWISPIAITFKPTVAGIQEAMILHYVAPDKMQIDIKSLKINLLSQTSRCRGGRGI